MSKAVLAVLAAAIAAAVLATSASADGPVAGTTFSTQCIFAVGHTTDDPGMTQCFQTIVIIQEGACWSIASGLRLWEEDDIASVRSYRGNAILPGLNGATLNVDYSGVVKPHSRLVYDSGPHAFGSTFPVDDPTCP